MRPRPVISQRELRRSLHFQPRPVAIAPFASRNRSRMNVKLAGKFNLRRPPQRLSQNLRLDFQLVLVTRMLVLAPAAALEVGASRLDPVRRGGVHPAEPSPSESRLLFGECCLNLFIFKHKGDENSFSGTMLVSRQPRQPIPAINQLLNL